ncbi:hypothetical protein SAMN05444380_1013 [Thermophagus xiamenensis]|jgi:hypothetical protein|uniref:Uncharacterized protein n=1 Tax=Thermophagus xiamenensis TaxID=385682 RepID=A0A1I1UAW4_9BACT|nr:hypothetical protein SAMN05444380_1013 [Thermophagus xiamenensis]
MMKFLNGNERATFVIKGFVLNDGGRSTQAAKLLGY